MGSQFGGFIAGQAEACGRLAGRKFDRQHDGQGNQRLRFQ
jgi:hypothetical protein